MCACVCVGELLAVKEVALGGVAKEQEAVEQLEQEVSTHPHPPTHTIEPGADHVAGTHASVRVCVCVCVYSSTGCGPEQLATSQHRDM